MHVGNDHLECEYVAVKAPTICQNIDNVANQQLLQRISLINKLKKQGINVRHTRNNKITGHLVKSIINMFVSS